MSPYSRGGTLRLKARMRMRSGRSYTRTKQNRKRPTTGVGVTENYDAKLIYRKKSMPPRKRKQWKAFVKKVDAVAERDLGTQTFVFNTSLSPSANTAGTQLVESVGLYGLRSATSHWSDINEIAGYIAGAATTTATGLAVGNSAKVIFKSAILDLTIRNNCTYNNSGIFTPASEAKMEVDIYDISMYDDAVSTTAFANPYSLFQENALNTLAVGGTGTEIQQNFRGVCPFDLTYVLSRYGVRINSKKKYTINNNDQITYQVRDPSRYSMTLGAMAQETGFNKPKMTRILYIIGKLSPGLTVGSAFGTYQQQLALGTTRKYSFKVENWTEDRTIFI